MAGMPVPRSVKAIALGLLLCAVTGTGIGLVQAADGKVELPDSVGMASPANGEQGAFNVTALGDFALGVQEGQPFTAMDYVRVGGGRIPDRLGRPTAVDSVGWSGLAWGGDGEGWAESGALDHFRAGTTELVAMGGTGNGSMPWSYQPVAVLPPQSGTIDYDITFWWYDELPSCLLTNQLQGRAVPTSEPVVLGACDLLGLLQLEDGLGFQALPGQRIAGYETVRLQLEADGVTVAFEVNSTLPVPLRAEVRFPAGAVIIDLVQFSPGTEAPSTLQAAGETSAWSLAPRQPWGPNDEGSRLAFRPSTAYKQAMQDPLFPDLRDFLASHPLAYPASISCDAIQSWQDLHASEDRYCAFLLSDGKESLEVFVMQSVRQPSRLGVPELVVTYQEISGPVNGTFPAPERVPTEWPTLRSIEDRFALFSPDAPVPDSAHVGLDYSWLVPGPGTDPTVSASAGLGSGGVQLVPFDPADPGVRYAGVDSAHRSVSLQGDGAASYFQATNLADQSEVALVPGPAKPLDKTEEDRPHVLAAMVGFWTSPDAAKVVQLGFLAALGSLLYYLWPALKGSFLGLFSRVSGPALLEHPARANLVQIIQAEPGIHFRDLVQRSGLPNGTAVHHLGKLTKSGLVTARPLGKYTCYFPGSSVERSALAAAGVLRTDSARRLYEAIRATPGLSGLELAQRLGLQPSTVHHHVQRLTEAGLVLGTRDGRSLRLHAVALAAAA